MHNRSARCALIAAALILAACGGGGGDAPAPTVVVSGKITFDRIPLKAPPQQGLNPDAQIESPASQVVVQVIDAGTNAVLASGVTDANGDYSLTVPSDRSVFIRVRAQMLKTGAAPTWDFEVRNNTNGDALYTLDGVPFETGTTNVTRNLRATSGWVGGGYDNALRAAAPFAILDTVYKVKELILAGDPSAVLPPLDLYWSPTNRATVNGFCPDRGDIGTTFYARGAIDECPTPQPLPAGVYILGDFANGVGDTDEFDEHVIAHELGHYFEDQFSRSDSLGGEHVGEPLDLRVAFGEGWGNAFAGMALGDPLYRDTFRGVSLDGVRIDMEADSALDGWYSELSVAEILWDIFDAPADPPDALQLPFARIYEVMIGPQVQTDAFTSIFSFSKALRDANPASAAAINALLSGENIARTDAFGADETNDGGLPDALPIYEEASLTFSSLQFCTSTTPNSLNKLGNRKFFRLVTNAPATITAQITGQAVAGVGSAATDPDVLIWRRGSIVASGESAVQGQETLSNVSLPAGVHIIEVYDFDQDLAPDRRCMIMTIQ